MHAKVFKPVFIFVILGFMLLGAAQRALADKAMDEAETAINQADTAINGKDGIKGTAAQRDGLWKQATAAGQEGLQAMNNRNDAEDKKQKADRAETDAWNTWKEADDKAQASGLEKDKQAAAKAKEELERAKDKFLEAVDRARKARENEEKIQEKKRKLLDEWAKAVEEYEKAKEEAKKAVDKAEEALKKDTTQPVRKKKLQERLDALKGIYEQLLLQLPKEQFSALGPMHLQDLDPSQVVASLGGTGETVGNIATLTLANKTDQPINVYIPPTVLESKSKKVQNYALTEPHDFTVGPRETKPFALSGICLDAHLPPAGPEDKDELVIIDPRVSGFEQVWKPLLDDSRAIKDTAEILQCEGAYTTPYAKNRRKELETITQWATWLATSTRAGKPITKQDLTKKVYEQTSQEVTQEQKKEIDKGIDGIWDAVQLTGKKAKLLTAEAPEKS